MPLNSYGLHDIFIFFNIKTYQILEIEDFKCSLPLSKNDEEVFPTGIAVNFNCTKQINFDKFDTQPACPILLMMTNKGTLVTFFVINLESTNKSICYPPEKLQLKNIQPGRFFCITILAYF